MPNVKKMFDYKGKTTKVIGKNRTKIYNEIYDYISNMQDTGELPTHPNYLNGNELAQSIYEKKYYLKDLENELIEKNPEDVFKRLASFLATVELSKSKFGVKM